MKDFINYCQLKVLSETMQSFTQIRIGLQFSLVVETYTTKRGAGGEILERRLFNLLFERMQFTGNRI